MKRFLIIILVLAVLGTGGYLAFTTWQNSQSAGQNNYQMIPVTRGDLTATVGATGTVRSNQSTTLAWQTTGHIGKIYVKVGDKVKADQILAELEQNSLQQSLILARSDLITAQRNLVNLKNSDLARAQAQQALAQAQQQLQDATENRYNKNYDRASQATIDQAKADLTLAKDAVKNAQEIYDRFATKPEDDPQRASAFSRLAAAQQKRDNSEWNLSYLLSLPDKMEISQADADVEVAKARVKDTQREWDRLKNGVDPQDMAAAEARIAAIEATLSLPFMKSPFAGSITDVRSLEGDQVGLSTISFRVDDLTHLLVDVQIPEVDINRVKVGQATRLSFDAIPRKDYNGKVISVARVGTVVQGAVNFTVTIELLDGDEDVRPAMTAAVNIVVDQLSNILQIPNRAVRSRSGNRIVYILSGGTPTPVEIKLGATSGDYSQLLSGDLKEGDELVLNPPLELPAGQLPFGR